MLKKINRIYKNIKYQISNIKYFQLFLSFLLLLLLFYTRFVGLSWGLPYPMHPDERNMANAIQQLNCQISDLKFRISNFRECGNPHFFAYGQFSLYLGYLMVLFLKFWNGNLNTPISFEEATIALRIISAIFSIITFITIIKVIKVIKKREEIQLFDFFISSLLVIFSPFFIQYSHFGTTESMLMFFYLYLVYLGLIFFDNKISNFSFILYSGFFSGLAMATKVSSVIFLIIPFLALLLKKKEIKKSIYFKNNNLFLYFYLFFLKAVDLIFFGFLSGLFFLFFSPHNFLNFNDFLNSMNYESGVGLGKYIVFYTQQFEYSIPVLFQIFKIIPYALGVGISLISLIGLIGEDWKNKKINFLRFAFFIYFLPNAFIFAKWTRFIAPIFPILLIFAILSINKIKVINVIKTIIVIILILPGVKYLYIYQKPDIRFQASEWIFKNIPENSYILSETANVIDIPIQYQISNIKYQILKNYNLISFDFYNLDNNPILQEELKKHLVKADYIIVPSRRIFANYTCYWPDKKENFLDKVVYENKRCEKLKEKFPLLNEYYKNLFLEKLGFKLIKEFSIFDFGFLKFNDEIAEETWSVFDHPVIRIYKKISNIKYQKSKIKMQNAKIPLAKAITLAIAGRQNDNVK